MNNKGSTLKDKLEDAQLDHYECGRRCKYDKTMTCLQFASLTLRQKMERKVRHLARKVTNGID